MLIFGDRGLLELKRLREESAAVARGNAELGERNRDLTRRVNQTRDDPATLERLARERLGMVKPGEAVYYVPRDGEGAPAQAPAPAPKPVVAQPASPGGTAPAASGHAQGPLKVTPEGPPQ